jgi:site-specific DNA-methyltransferase (cytosine-N4-specific)
MSENPYYQDESVTLHHGDALTVLSSLPDASVNCCVTSPPYFGLRDYGVEGQLGLEASPAEYVENLRALFAQVRHVLADDGTFWLNLGDSYAGSGKGRWGDGSSNATGKQATNVGSTMGTLTKDASGLPAKNLLGIPWRVAFALQDDGWILRSEIIWAKPNAMPEPVTDRVSTKHEHLFLLTKGPRYWFDLDPIREPHVSDPSRAGKNALRGQKAIRPVGPNSGAYSEGGRNPGDVWRIATQPFPDAHFATMPSTLAERAIQAGCKPGGTGPRPIQRLRHHRACSSPPRPQVLGIDLNAEYLDLSLRTRLAQPGLDFDTKEAI